MALFARDVVLLRKSVSVFALRTVLQPLLFVFVFTYVFPRVGQRVSGPDASADFSTLLVPGLVAIASLFQGIQAVALPLANDLGHTTEIEDRVMAPLPVWALAAQKVLSGATQSVLAGLVVLPLALAIPDTPVDLDVRWPVLLTVGPLSALVGAAMGLVLGARADPRQVPLLFSIIIIPVTFLGAAYYPWPRLSSIPWLKWAVLVNPLVYMSDGLRAALTPQFDHMPIAAVHAGLVGFAALLLHLGVSGFRKRLLV